MFQSLLTNDLSSFKHSCTNFVILSPIFQKKKKEKKRECNENENTKEKEQ